MPAVSKKQQRFFGMVRAAQKGEMASPSVEVSKAASSMSKSDVKKFAKTKHKGLPEKVKSEGFLNIEIPKSNEDFIKGLMFRESLDIDSGMLFIFDEVDYQSFHMRETKIPLDIAFITEDGIIESIKQLEPYDETPVASDGKILCALEVNRGWFVENNINVGDDIDFFEEEIPQELSEKKNGRCPTGQYYCYTDKKCKPIPRGFRVVGRAGMLRKETGHTQDDETNGKKNGKKNGGVSNGNGNGNGGNGNGGHSSGSNGGNGGGGVSEGWSDKYKKSIDCDNPKGFSQKAHCQGKKKSLKEYYGMPGGMGSSRSKESRNNPEYQKSKERVDSLLAAVKRGREKRKKEAKMNEESNPRIPRKKGQPANSKKHSDLYTDENPKGTIHGLGFKDVATAKASVSKIRNSSRSHAHKIQAAVAMEQRAREMGKSSEAAVYRKYINSMKKKTKEKNESYDANDYNTLKDQVGSAKKHRKTLKQFTDKSKS